MNDADAKEDGFQRDMTEPMKKSLFPGIETYNGISEIHQTAQWQHEKVAGRGIRNKQAKK